jgi:DNA-binding response OmpR family regulator
MPPPLNPLNRSEKRGDKPAEKPAEKIDILVIEDDLASQTALRQILDSDDWSVHISPLANVALQDLATRAWTLVIANIAMTGLTSPLFTTLRELALAPALESGKSRLRVLFLVPQNPDPQWRSTLESQHLPYLFKPFHLHDLLDRVSDLLMETSAIAAPIRRVRQDGPTSGRRELRTFGSAGSGQGPSRNTSMFANYSDYGMTEEEMAEYERQENEETQRKKKKKLNPNSI